MPRSAGWCLLETDPWCCWIHENLDLGYRIQYVRRDLFLVPGFSFRSPLGANHLWTATWQQNPMAPWWFFQPEKLRNCHYMWWVEANFPKLQHEWNTFGIGLVRISVLIQTHPNMPDLSSAMCICKVPLASGRTQAFCPTRSTGEGGDKGRAQAGGLGWNEIATSASKSPKFGDFGQNWIPSWELIYIFCFSHPRYVWRWLSLFPRWDMLVPWRVCNYTGLPPKGSLSCFFLKAGFCWNR